MDTTADRESSGDACDDLLTEAQDAFFVGNMEAAVSLCKTLLEKWPEERDAYPLLFVCLHRLERFGEGTTIHISMM